MKLALNGVLIMALALPVNAARVTIPAGTPVVVRLESAVGSGTHHKGDLVSMTVQGDVTINGKTVIKTGSPAQGVVDDVARRFFAGIGGYIKLSAQFAKAVDGTSVPLKFEKQDTGQANILGAIIGIVCCICFLLIRGDDVTLQPGTLYNAVTLGPIEVEAP